MTSISSDTPATPAATAGPSGPASGRATGNTRPMPSERAIWTGVCVLILVLAVVIVRTAKTSPGYDPYGWLVWGYQGIRGTLDLAGAPSWKPITFLFTLPFSLFGHYEYWLWLTTDLAITLGGPVVAGRIAWRTVRPRSAQAWPAAVAALFAAGGIVMIVGNDTGAAPYAHYVLSYQSDPMLVTFFLLAVDAFISRRYRWAHTWLLLVSLGRPEGWVILGPFALWLWFKQPQLRKFSVAELLVIPIMWFGVPVICGQPWDVAGNLAQNSPRELHHNKIVGVLDRYFDLTFWPVFVAAIVGAVYGAVTRNRVALIATAAPIAWMICEVAFALHGWPAVARYMFEAGAATIVLGGIGVGMLATWAADHGPLLRRLGAAAFALVLIGFMVPYAKNEWDVEHVDLLQQQARTREIGLLHETISEIGGPAFVNSCGIPTTDVGAASLLSYYTHNNVSTVGYIPKYEISLGVPVILFTGLYNGWVVHTYHLKPTAPQRCAALNDTYVVVRPGHTLPSLIHG